jgi:hypothetical protein
MENLFEEKDRESQGNNVLASKVEALSRSDFNCKEDELMRELGEKERAIEGLREELQ